MRQLFLATLLLLASVSCVREEIPEGEVYIDFRISSSKSSLLSSDTEIKSFSVCAYSSGRLEGSVQWRQGASGPSRLRLVSGRSYDLYCLANAPESEWPSEESALEHLSCRMLTESGLPMCWSSSGRVFSESGTVFIDFERLAAKLRLSLDKQALNGARISSVRLRHASVEICPFVLSNKALSISDVADGDFASEHDLETLNSGEVLELYALENCQGRLLTNNYTPWRKIPPAGKENLCTCLELVCDFLDGSPIQGEAIYRFYPGKDALNDFSLERNSCVDLRLTLTDVGLDLAVNLVENNTEYRDGHVSYSLYSGLHDIDDMYVGEMLRFAFHPSEELLSFWSEERFLDAQIVLACENQSEIYRIEDSMDISSIYKEDGQYFFDVTVLKPLGTPLNCNFYLYDDISGKLVSKMRSVTVPDSEMRIQSAFLGIAELDAQGRCLLDPADGLRSLDLIVNGDEKRLGLYLMDESGAIFPNDRVQYFNPDVYSSLKASYQCNGLRNLCTVSQQESVLDCCKLRLKRMYRNYPYPFCELECSIVNSGTEASANQGLSIGLMKDNMLNLLIEASGLTYLNQSVGIDALPWKAWLLSEYSDCGFVLNPEPGNRTQLALYNPSHLDLDLFLGCLLHPGVLSSSSNNCHFVDSSTDVRHSYMSRIECVLHSDRAASILGDNPNCYRASIEAYDADVYRVQYGYSAFCDLASVYSNFRFNNTQNSVYLHALDGSDCGTFIEARLNSLGGNVVPGSTFTDLSAQTSSTDFDVYRYRGLTLWENGSIVRTADIDPLGPHSVEDLKTVVSSQGVDFEFSWSSDGSLYCRIGDDGDRGRIYRVMARPAYYVYLYYTPDNGKTFYYQDNDHGFSVFPSLYRINWETDSRLTSKASYYAASGSYGRMAYLAPMEKEMALINRSYCMASSSDESYYGSGTTGRSHRWSTMALPQRIEMEISITCDSPDWVPVELSLNTATRTLQNYTFYDRTRIGYFAEYATAGPHNYVYAGTNPDGSPQTNGAGGMPVTNHCVLPEITSSATASNVISIDVCEVELAVSDRGVSRIAYR